MPSFEWKGRDRDGNTQTGVLIGDNKDAVVAALRRQQIVVTTVNDLRLTEVQINFRGSPPPVCDGAAFAIDTRQRAQVLGRADQGPQAKCQ